MRVLVERVRILLSQGVNPPGQLLRASMCTKVGASTYT